MSDPPGWEALGYVRAGDYAREELGLSGRDLLDLVAVDARLEALPRVEAAFVTGRLSWTKARLLCRVATPEEEGAWIEVAAATSAAALARQVRRVDRESLEAGGAAVALAPETDETGAPEAAWEVLRVRCAPVVLAKWGDLRRLARRTAHGAVSAAECAELVAAEVLSGIRLEVDPETLPPAPLRGRTPAPGDAPAIVPGPAVVPGRGAVPSLAAVSHPGAGTGLEAVARTGGRPGLGLGAGASTGARPGLGAGAGAAAGADLGAGRDTTGEPAAFLASLVEGLAEADSQEVHRRLRRAVALERVRRARMGPLLLALAEGRRYRDLGFGSVDAYARERLGMAPRTARALLRVERTAHEAPAFGEASRRGELSFSQARVLGALMAVAETRPWQDAWLRRARQVSVRRLGDDVDHALATGGLDPAALPALPTRCTAPAEGGGDPLAPAGVGGVPGGGLGELGVGGVPGRGPGNVGVGSVAGGVTGASGASPAASDSAIGAWGGNVDASVGGVGSAEADRSMGEESIGTERAGARALVSAIPAGLHTGARPRGIEGRSTWRCGAPLDLARLFRACLFSVQRHLERARGRAVLPGEALEAMFDHARATWTLREKGRAPREHRVFDRDDWRCSVPGCSSTGALHAHHVRFRSAGGGDELANLTTLCAAHHQRGVHGGGPGRIRIRGRAPEDLRFEMPLATWRAGDLREEPEGPEVPATLGFGSRADE